MNLVQNAPQNFKSFEQTISSIMDGSYDQDVNTMLLQIKCGMIRMDTEISMALYPKATGRCLELYVRRITKYLDCIKEKQGLANAMQLELLDVVYGKLYRLYHFIKELLVEKK